MVRQPTRKRVPTERGAVVACDDASRHIFRDDGRTDWKPISQCFGCSEDVRVGGRRQCGVGPEGTGARHSALYLVVDEDGTDVVAAVAECLEKFRCGDVDAAFALDRLDDYAAGVFCDEGSEVGCIVEGSVFEAGKHGGERFLIFGIRCCGEGAHSAAVEGAVEADDFVFGGGFWGGGAGLANFAGEFDGGFVGFGAGVADEGF